MAKKKVEVLPAESDLPPEKSKEELRLERDMQIVHLVAGEEHTYIEIGELLDCSARTVSRIAKKYGNLLSTLGNLDTFREIKTDLMEGVQLEALKSIVASGKLEDSTAQQAVSIVEKLNTMIRLDQNKSTSNTELHIKNYTD